MIKQLIYNFFKSLKYQLSQYIIRTGHFGFYDETSVIAPPSLISGSHNIYIYENVNIAPDSVLFATHAKIYIKKYFISANGLQIITGAHERRIGRFCASITEEEKNMDIGLDKDITICEDVWAGMNVTILPGVTIGRGCTVATGAVVSTSTPPYSVVGGIPAKFIKFYWTIDEIIQHEFQLYPKNLRYTKSQLEEYFNRYK